MIKSLNKILIYEYGILLFVLLIPIWRLGSNLILAFDILLVFLLLKEYKIRNFFWLFIPLLFYHILMSFLNDFNISDINNYFRFLIIFIAIPFAFIKTSDSILKKTLNAFIIGTFIIQLNSIRGLLLYYYENGKIPQMNNYAKINEILLFERPYLGFFSAMALLFALNYLIATKRKIYILPIAVSISIIFYISARLAALLVVIYFITYGFIIFKKKLLKISYFIITFGILLAIFNSSNFDLNRRFSKINDDARIIIWSNAFEILKEKNKYVLGTNNRTGVKTDLKEKFKTDIRFKKEDRRDWFIKSNYNTHNQYLDELIVGGVLGLILLVYPFFYLMFYALKRNNVLSVLVIFSLFSFLFLENVFERQKGIFLFTYLLIIVYRDINLKHRKTSND